jgi:putative lipoic acid-binding regulatory protein
MNRHRHLRDLLEKEIYPSLFPFKFVGKNSEPFLKGVASLEKMYPNLALQTKRLSRTQQYLSYTYNYPAKSADEIISIFDEISKIPDLAINL